MTLPYKEDNHEKKKAVDTMPIQELSEAMNGWKYLD